MMLASTKWMNGPKWENAAVYHSPAYSPMMNDSMKICYGYRPLTMMNSSYLASYFAVTKSIRNVAHRTIPPFGYSIVRFGSMDAVNHSSWIALAAVCHTLPDRTLWRNFGMGCLNGLVFSVGDHTSRRRHTFVVLQPMRIKRRERKKKRKQTKQ